MALDELRNKYRREFVAADYRDLVTTHSFLGHLYQRELHSIFESLPDRKRSLLDVGCGPTSHNVFPASKHVQDIVLSDYVLGNRVEVEKWLKNAPDALDWSCCSESLARLEGFRDVRQGAEEITARTRNAVRKVIPCDVLDPRVLPEEYLEKFGVVLSSLCLECACTDEDTFCKAVLNVGGLVGDGGILILCGVLGCREYTGGTRTFPSLCLTPEMVKGALVQAGFQVTLWLSVESSVRLPSSFESAFIVMAEKL